MRAVARALAAALLVLVAGCATLYGLSAPRVSVASITPREFTLLEQKFLVQVRVQNPNDLDLAVKGMTFDLDVNGRRFASGVSSQAVVIPRFSSALVDVEVVSGLADLVRQFRGRKGEDMAPKLAWRLRGKVHLDQPFATALAYDESGEIDLGRRDAAPRS